MPERTQLNININPDLLKNLKKIALENNRKLVELINEVLTNYIQEIKNDQTKYRSILDELDDVKNRISVLENSKN
ncbi:possible Helix-turn-helix protein, copG family [Prochlorococcus marinus subsp. pastoris str. CCMP1986]|jgi:mRNA-degrading endonuclease RelE of RelBE toxin-antitoxin system|uniref:Possible Helix-turn-helix protein, copG family n=1 Tax=Prochlorococcus marinus subsp. pastoris (strain CCMP1986 / NIES-2087 / MED4) TaxID=59919 RepID=Q7TU53_PROMP|nr:hypothetical protein [Prochlorococcus marinus]KGF87013.1 hypothetical protein PROCH_0598 [Prochlorococcus marinus str. EQPAC1]CAE19850.1 possible Helix-turn-helix protein, copG family [Prochlorococcus marinus subsp. pastoris str. CCMP1986]